MIVRCPECQTGFNLAKEKIPAKGAKLRCSKCNHLFRVRITDDRTEIFYKSSDKEKNRSHVDPNATQIGGPHRPKIEQIRETHQLETIERGGETRFGAPARTGTSPRTKGVQANKTQHSFSNEEQRTFAPVKPTMKALRAPVLTPIITPPATKEKGFAEEKSDAIPPAKPVIASSRRKLTPVPSDHLDLFGDDSGFNFSNNDPSIEDPFFGAFDEPEEEELFPTDSKSFFSDPAFSNDISSQENESIAMSEISVVETKAKPPSLPPARENPSPPTDFQSNSLDDSKNGEDYFSRGGSARSFESLGASSEVSEAENKDIPIHVDLRADKEEKKTDVKVEKREPKLELAIKPQVINKPRKKPSEGAKSGKRSPRKESTRARQPIALKPHKIGGNSFRRLFDTLFIALFLSACFIAFIAYKAGGIFDFNNPLHMLEVAFEGKPYKTDTSQRDLYISDVTAIPYELTKKNHVLIVNGSVHNPNDKSKNANTIYVVISTKDGEEKQEVHIGEHLDISQFKERGKGKSLSTKKVDILKKGSTPFFVVFRKGDSFRKLSLRTLIDQ